MRGDDLSAEEVALARLTGGLLIASGLLIAGLCGGCTLTALSVSNSSGMAPLALVVGGAPAAAGLSLAGFGVKQLAHNRRVEPIASSNFGVAAALGWALAGLGLVIALAATYEISLDLWVLLNAMEGRLNPPGGGFLAFFAALGHALLFILSAGAVDLGRRIIGSARS